MRGRGQAIAVVVAVDPRLAGGGVGFANEVAVLVVEIIPNAVAGQLVGEAGRIARHRPVAIQIVTVRHYAVVDQFVRDIIAIIRRRAAVECLRSDAARQIKGVDIIGNVVALAVFTVMRSQSLVLSLPRNHFFHFFSEQFCSMYLREMEALMRDFGCFGSSSRTRASSSRNGK